jgi:hypothetical protein
MEMRWTMRAVAVAIAAVCVLAACAPDPTATSPSPTGVASPTASPTPPATVAAVTATPGATQSAPLPTAKLPPATPPAAAQRCAPQSGGDQKVNRVLSAVRAARQPGYDRVVFDFGPGALPPFTVEQVDRVIQGGSGFVQPVDGSVFFNVRFIQAGGAGEYRERTQLRPDTENVREVVLSTNFEGVLEFGIGLSRHACPRVSVLASPARVLLDFE